TSIVGPWRTSARLASGPPVPRLEGTHRRPDAGTRPGGRVEMTVVAEPSTSGEDVAPGTRPSEGAGTVPDSPSRPATDHRSELGFVRRPMVRWFDPHQLLDTARRVVLSGVFGSYTDQRLLQ